VDVLDDKSLIEQISDPAARALVSRYQRTVALLELKVQALEERLGLDRIARYGNRSEKLSDMQLELLDLEPAVASDEIAAESERPHLTNTDQNTTATTSAKPARAKHPGRNQLPAHLSRVEKIIACTPAQCVCGKCGHETKVIGYEEAEVLDVKPAEYFVTVIKREKRACARVLNGALQRQHQLNESRRSRSSLMQC